MFKDTLLGALILTVVLLAVMSAGCKAKQAPKPGDNEVIEVKTAAATNPEELFKQSCSRCHIIGKAVTYSGETPWKEIVDRMIIHNAKITPENAALIVKHLDTTYPRQKPATF
ncbi:MAG: hypothetical protein NTZ09_06860 [Candidatus Hydrogenedentes bacterium]|nr:hypothetical protein [Candidatus Hydrogenedentota bacterium]